jgi:hypothetical protein
VARGQKGRPRKPGKRNKSGRLLSSIPRDNGTDQAILRRDMFGENGADAIGRAFVIGALGTGTIARDRLAFARGMYADYWQWSPLANYRCALDKSPVGSSEPTAERIEAMKRRDARLTRNLERARKAGHAEYRAFEQLVIDINPDSGPSWLDGLCMLHFLRTLLPDLKPRPEDSTAVARSLRALDAAMGIVADMREAA